MSIFWDQSPNIPTVIQGFAIALLAILIPLAIAILQDIYQKKKSPDAEYVDLDLHVALDYVFRIKTLVLCLVLIFLPMLFWHASTGLLRWLLLASSFSGIAVILLLPLRNIYRWVKGNAFPFQLKYLANLRNDEDLPVVWRSVWKVQNINIQNEIEFFEKFRTTIDRLVRKVEAKPNLTATLFGDFATFIAHRSTSLLVASNEGLPKILEWHYMIWMEEHIRLIEGKRGGIWWPYFRITGTLELAIKKATERAMQSRAFEVFPFFSHVKKHVGLHESDHVGKDTGKRYYVDRFLSLFYHVFFETVADSPERYEIWESHFPKEWQITVDRLKTSKLSEISLKAYLNWASPRIRDPEVQFDKNLDDVTMNIFPESEPMAWAMVLMFAYTSWGTSRVEAMIARPWNFGRVGRPVFYSGTIEEDESQRDQARLVRLEETRRQQLTETFELAQRFFPESFSKTSLEQFVGELQQLNYEDGTQEERKRVSLLEFFQEMLEFLNSSRTQSSGVSET